MQNKEENERLEAFLDTSKFGPIISSMKAKPAKTSKDWHKEIPVEARNHFMRKIAYAVYYAGMALSKFPSKEVLLEGLALIDVFAQKSEADIFESSRLAAEYQVRMSQRFNKLGETLIELDKATDKSKRDSQEYTDLVKQVITLLESELNK